MAIIDPEKLLEHLCAEPRETEWLEFKVNNFSAEDCGKYISGLANAAILKDEPHAYLVFGVENNNHHIVGTDIRLKSEKIGGEPLENWLARLLDPKLTLSFLEVETVEGHVEIIVIEPAYERPVRFKNDRYIRIDSVLKNLKEFPERERALWQITSRFAFEQGVAADHLNEKAILSQFYCDQFFKLLGLHNLSQQAIIDHLLMEEMIIDDKQGGFDVTNLFALLCAKDLREFPSVAGKAPRVIHYEGKSKIKAIGDETGQRGYAIAFPMMLRHIMSKVPHKEEIRHGVRENVYSYPELAIREFVANALIHQDLTSQQGRPLIEIYSDRLEITNPGVPLVPTDRFIDAPAKSRNEKLAGIMRRLGYCEERGSGIDRALDAIEMQALPPPLFRVVEGSTIVTMQREKTFANMSKDDRLRASYQHACLRFVSGDPMNNGSLRTRFGLSKAQYPQVSMVIRDAIDAALIKPMDEDQANRNARYIPAWA